MSISSIIIDNNKTKAKRIASDKVQLDLVAMPLDKENDMEPNVELRLYVNHELLQNLRSDVDGYVKESLVITNEEGESITVRLEDLKQEIKSKIKCLMIEKGESQEDKKKEPVKREISAEEKKEEIVNFVRKRGQNLSDEKCKEYLNDFDVVMAAISSKFTQGGPNSFPNDGLALQFASGNMKCNYDIVMAAVTTNGLALQYAHPSFRNIKEICLAAIKQNTLAYNLFSDHILWDEKILEYIFKAAQKDSLMLNKLHKLPASIKKEFDALLRSDIQAFSKTTHSFVKNDKEMVLSVIQKGDYTTIPNIFDNMPDMFKNDIEMIKKIIDVLGDKSYLDSVSYSSSVLSLFTDIIKNNEDVMLYLFCKMKKRGNSLYERNYSNFFKFVGEDLFNSENFVLSVFPDDFYNYGSYNSRKRSIIHHLSSIHKCTLINNKKFILKLITLPQESAPKDYDSSYDIHKRLREITSPLLEDEDFVLSVFKEMHVESFLSATQYNGEIIYDKKMLRKIKDILEEKDKNSASQFASAHKLSFDKDFPEEYAKLLIEENKKRQKEEQDLIMKKNQEIEKEKNRRNTLKTEYLILIKKDPHNLQNFEKWALDDKEIVKAALIGDQKLFSMVSESLKNSEEFSLECIDTFGIIIVRYFQQQTRNLPKIKNRIDNISDKERNDIALSLKEIPIGNWDSVFKKLPDSWKEDNELVKNILSAWFEKIKIDKYSQKSMSDIQNVIRGLSNTLKNKKLLMIDCFCEIGKYMDLNMFKEYVCLLGSNILQDKDFLLIVFRTYYSWNYKNYSGINIDEAVLNIIRTIKGKVVEYDSLERELKKSIKEIKKGGKKDFFDIIKDFLS